MAMHCDKSGSLSLGLADAYMRRAEVQSHGEFSRFLSDVSCRPEDLSACGVSPFFLVLCMEEYLKDGNLRMQTRMNYCEFADKLDEVVFCLESFLNSMVASDESQMRCGEQLLGFYFAKNVSIELDMRLPLLYALLDRAYNVGRRFDHVLVEIDRSSTGELLSGVRYRIGSIFQDPN